MRAWNSVRGHHPDVVINDLRELRIFAEQEFEAWWQTLETHRYSGDPEPNFKGVQAVFVSAFMNNYSALMNKYRQEKQQLDRYRGMGTGGPTSGPSPDVSIQVAKVRRFEDANLYEIELRDPGHLADPVKAEIVVRGGGDTEVRESGYDV